MSLPMDDNLRGLLVELAERPERTVLGTRVRRFQDLLRPDVEVLRPSTEMGVVEAKLLEAHREELAWLLLQASRIRFTELARVQLAPRDESGRPQYVSPEVVHGRARAVLSASFSSSATHGSVRLLNSALLDVDGVPPLPSALAVASVRLAPQDAARIWLATYVGSEGDPRRSIDIQSQLLERISSHHLGYVWTNIAGESAALGRFHDALETGRRAHFEAPGFGRAALAWFLAAVQCGSARETLSASSALAEILVEGSEEASEFSLYLSQRRDLNQWRPTAASDFISTLAGLPAVAEQLLEAFH